MVSLSGVLHASEVTPNSSPRRRYVGRRDRGAVGRGGYPPPTPSSTTPVPRQALQRLPSIRPLPSHSGHRLGPEGVSSAGTSSAGFRLSACSIPSVYPAQRAVCSGQLTLGVVASGAHELAGSRRAAAPGWVGAFPPRPVRGPR